MKNVFVLGAGMVGHAIARDLANRFQVTSVDVSDRALEAVQKADERIQTRQADLMDFERYTEMLRGADWVVAAVPGFMGYRCLEAIIRAGKSGVDISFFPEDALQLAGLAKEKNVTIITDCGVAPGMSNLVAGYYSKRMKIEKLSCYVGGLPKEKTPPFQYKAPFSPIDVLEEYTRPARIKRGGQILTVPALTEREIRNYQQVGELEAFNTDGLRSLLFTLPEIPEMIEKTLRYPGHIDIIIALQQAGFFSEESVVVNGNTVKPLDLSAALLLKMWKLEPTDDEFTIMEVILESGDRKIVYSLYDERDKQTGLSSMARSTGFTCTAALNVLEEGLFKEKGVFPPELLAQQEGCFEYILAYLSKRNVRWQKEEIKG